jgi:hypothetical protein
MENMGVKEIWNLIKLEYNRVVDKWVPEVRNKKPKKSSFISKGSLKLIKQREDLFQVYRRTKLSIDHDRYKSVRNEVNKSIRIDKINESKRLVSAL